MPATILLSVAIAGLFLKAIHHLWKNGTCSGCSQKGACHPTSQEQGCGSSCAHCCHCHTNPSSTLKKP